MPLLNVQTTSVCKALNHCLIYGRAKSGKTRLAPTAPKPFIVSTDAGLSSIREYDLPFHNVKAHKDYLLVEQAFQKGELSNYQTLIIDDLTELAEIFLTERKPHYKNLKQAYGDLNDEMMRVIRFWRCQEQITVVFICKEEKTKDEYTGAITYGPCIPGKAVSPMLPYLLGSVYHMEIWTDPATGKNHEVLRCKQNNQYEAGDRSGKLGELEFPNLSSIFAKSQS